MKKIPILLILTLGLILVSCKKENTEPIDDYVLVTGNFIDVRDSQSYNWVILKDGNKWMSENLNYDTTDSWCSDNLEINCDEYGRLYNWSSALTVCPKGWYLPSENEWRVMTEKYGGDYFNSDDEGRAAYRALVGAGSSGFSAQLGGSFIHPLDVGRIGLYWSSTEHENHSWQSYSYGFRRSDGIASRFFLDKTRALSCRCIED